MGEGKGNGCACGGSCPCHNGGASCGMGCCGHMHRHKLVKAIIALIILVAIFCFGVQLGRLQTLSEFYAPHYGMMQYGWYGGQTTAVQATGTVTK